MIPLHPIVDAEFSCPHCHIRLAVKGWYIPGMRNLAEMACSQCGREFYGDLPSGHGLYFPMLLEKATGVVHERLSVPFFSEWLRVSYAQRRSEPLNLHAEEYKPARRAVLLNCLDYRYGHCLLKLLNAQHYLDRRPDLGLIVLVPRYLRWLVPEGVASIWTVDLPLSRGIEWNDMLAGELRRRVGELQTCLLSVAFSHPHPGDYNIERFTRMQPFPLVEWEKRLARPTITFVWREDRLWLAGDRNGHGLFARVARRIKGRSSASQISVAHQSQQVVALATALRARWETLDFAVVGLGKAGGMPDWIADLRRTDIDEATERIWCQRYACSHIVIGVHGSNMLLPSAHAAAVIELVPPDRWGNVPQATLFRLSDPREIAHRYRYYPLHTTVDDLASSIFQLVMSHRFMTLTMPAMVSSHSNMTSQESLYFLRTTLEASN